MYASARPRTLPHGLGNARIIRTTSVASRVHEELMRQCLVLRMESGFPSSVDRSSEPPCCVCIGTVAGGCWKCVLVQIFASIGRSNSVFIAEIRELSVNNEHRCVHPRKVSTCLSFSRSSLSGLSLGGHISCVGIRYCMGEAWMLDVCFIGTSHHFSYHTS